MSTKDNKPDLSNLKSRLGLNKKKQAKKSEKKEEPEPTSDRSAADSSSQSSAAPSRGGATTGSQQATAPSPQPSQTQGNAQSNPTGSGSQQVASTPSGPAQPAARKPGPPPGAKGPPPTAMKPQKTQQKSQSTASTPLDTGSMDADMGDLDVDMDQGGSMFSAPVLVLFVVLAVVSSIFGFLAAQSSQVRTVEQTRIDDATVLQERLGERVEEFHEALDIIGTLDPMDVDFEAASELANYQFVFEARLLPGNRILLGDQIVGPLHDYMAQSHRLHQLIAEHERLTTSTDRDELEAFIEETEKLGDGDQIAVVFDLPTLQRHFISDEEPHEYEALQGRLVSVAEDAEPDEEGMIDIHVFASDAGDQVDVRHLVPIVYSDFIDVETGNAMQRYRDRVQDIAERAEELEALTERLMDAVDETANADPPPLFTLSASDEPDDELEEPADLEEPTDLEE